MSFPVEAPPESPGHVGHTPQHPDVMIRRARARGVETSGVLTSYSPVPYAMQAFPRAPQHFERASQVTTLLRMEQYRSRRDLRQPETLDYDVSVILGYNPPPVPTAVELEREAAAAQAAAVAARGGRR